MTDHLPNGIFSFQMFWSAVLWVKKTGVSVFVFSKRLELIILKYLLKVGI